MEHDKIETMLNEHEERLKKIEEMILKSGQTTSTPVSLKKISISEFSAEKNPSDDLQRTAIFAYFLDKYEGKEYFNFDDIQACFTKSKSSKPANIHDKINKCIQKGWISEHSEKKDSKKAFYLTNKGVMAVEGGFKE